MIKTALLIITSITVLFTALILSVPLGLVAGSLMVELGGTDGMIVFATLFAFFGTYGLGFITILYLVRSVK